MGKYYLYNVNYKGEDALKAFSVTDSGKIYFYNMDYAKFRNPLGLSDVCPISVISGAYVGRPIIFYAAAKRKREIKAYYNHIRNYNVFDKVINDFKDKSLQNYYYNLSILIKTYKNNNKIIDNMLDSLLSNPNISSI